MEKAIGTVIHYYDKIRVAIVQLAGTLSVGDKVKFKRHDKEFEQTVASMQIEHEPVSTAKKGQVIGVKVAQESKEGAEVFKLSEAPAAPAAPKTAVVVRPGRRPAQRKTRVAKKPPRASRARVRKVKPKRKGLKPKRRKR